MPIMDAYPVKCPICHTVSTVRNKVLAMGVVLAVQPTTDANLVASVCCMDDIGYLTMGSTVVLDKCVAITDVSVVNRLLQDLTSIRALKRYESEDVAVAHRMSYNVCHSKMHRQQSNCTRMAFVKRPPMQPIVHERKLVTFDEHMIVLRRLLPMVRIVSIQFGIFQLGVVSESSQYRMDHGNRRAHRCHWLRPFSCDLHNLSTDSLRPLLALHDVVTSGR